MVKMKVADDMYLHMRAGVSLVSELPLKNKNHDLRTRHIFGTQQTNRTRDMPIEEANRFYPSKALA